MKKLLILPLFVGWLGSFAQVTIIDSTISIKDNTIFSENNNSNGAGTFLFAGRNGLGNLRRALLKFSILSMHPDSFKSISVRMHVNQVSNTIMRTLGLHKITSDWGEGTSNSTSGSGTAPTTNDATWNFSFFNTQSWSSPGGAYVPVASASVAVSDLGYYTFSGPGLLADYKSWINNPGANFGWIVIGDEVVNNSAKRVDSKESIAADAPRIFAIYNPAVAPVTLVNFKAKSLNNIVRLTWQTMSEFNNSLFRIEHSINGILFRTIGNVQGAGVSNRVRSYSFDHPVVPGNNFYRLVAVDINGALQYSRVVSVYSKQNYRLLTVMPNPADEFIRIPGIDNNRVRKFIIYNGQGVVVKDGKLQGDFIQVTKLPPGTYYIDIKLENENLRSKFIKR